LEKQRKTRELYFSKRVTEAMKRIFDYPLTIVEAPMGYGKTTAVREHLGKARANILWQKVYDSSVNSFWNGLCSMFKKVWSAPDLCTSFIVRNQMIN
jgi:LuxR family maltose regulon positive regulatory protein